LPTFHNESGNNNLTAKYKWSSDC